MVVAGSASTASATHVRASADAASDPLIAAAGDIACDPSSGKFHGGQGTSSACRAKATGDLVVADPAIDAVLALGDNQYQCGGYQAYLQSFDLAWGRFKSKIHPVPGDNEYETSGTDCASGAAGYFRYFGAAAGDSRGDYAWTLGGWRLVALNAECGHAGGCGSSSAQATFLKDQLGAATCTLVYWHQPYYKGTSQWSSSYAAFWNILYAGNADVVLNGHLHNYSGSRRRTRAGTSTQLGASASSSSAPADGACSRSTAPTTSRRRRRRTGSSSSGCTRPVTRGSS